MFENFSGMNCENRLYRPIDSLNISGSNNKTYIYSSVNSIKVNGINQRIYCNFINSRVNTIYITGMNNIIYLNHNSNFCTQNISGANNRIIFTDNQNDNNAGDQQFNNGYQIYQRNLGGPGLLGNNQNPDNQINNDRNNDNNESNDYPSAPINTNNNSNNLINSINEFLYEKRYDYDIIDEEKCNICNTKFNNNDNIKKMECGHIYHKYCLDKFLERQRNNDNLPLCLICFQWEMQDSINKRNI